jgi:hypothetical protein
MRGDNQTIPGDLVRYLRRGVKEQQIATLEILKIQHENTLDRETYGKALARFDEGRRLLDTIGLADESQPQGIQLDLPRYPRVTLRALQEEHRLELLRLETAYREGFAPPTNNVLVLSALLEEIRAKVGTAPRRSRTPVFSSRPRTRGRSEQKKRRDSA